MNKFAFLLAILPALFATSCIGGDEIYEGALNTFQEDYTVYWDTRESNHWLEGSDDSGHYYYCEIREPRLTNYIMNKGMINAYLSYVPKGTDYSVLAPLPFSDFIVDQYNYKWEEHLTVEFSTGWITFILKIDDHVPIEPFYPDYTFVVKCMW